ncbi:MAG TPA: Nramp family divalent metal transporter [Vicinamibacterales bacterium]|nr:Nramp family divalent metal transporter [Vicinamibacterales bacterium]
MSSPTAPAEPLTNLLPASHGELPRWKVEDLPEPLPFGFRNMLRVIGPGAIMAATSIGGGEWLVGPAAAVKYGSSIFLIATIAILLQVVFNLEAIRYTVYTGEPILGGIMRLKPGPRFWAWFYSALAFFQLGWPALAGSAAATLLGAYMGRMPGSPDQVTQGWIAAGLIVAVVLVLSVGGTIERMLEYFAWTMLAVVFVFLVAVNVAFVPIAHWGRTFLGFFSFTGLPHPIDWGLIGALAATAGSGGIGNLTVSNWVRDKGFGMGAKVGAIPSAVGGHAIHLSRVGAVFPATEENIVRWREWMRYVRADQLWVWGFLCFLGMFLNVNLATAIVPPGTDLQGLAAGAYQAEYLARIWSPLWALTLFNGFWILFKTQLGNTDVLVRTITDAAWMAGSRTHEWRVGIRGVYYGVLAVFSIWGIIAIQIASPFQLFKILANLAGIVLLVAGVQIFIVNRRFLPAALRPRAWQEAALLVCSGFYAFFAYFVVRDVFRAMF